MQLPSFVGIDVSKDTLDTYNPIYKSNKFKNDKRGWISLFKYYESDSDTFWFIVENTGGHERQLVHFLLETGARVSILHGRSVRLYKEGRNVVAKTDKQDAIDIHDYAKTLFVEGRLREWEPKDETVEMGDRLIVTINQMLEQRTRWINRKKQYIKMGVHKGQVQRINNAMIKTFENRIKKSKKHLIDSFNKEFPDLMSIVKSVPGIADYTAVAILCHFNCFKNFDTQTKVGSMSGLIPIKSLSGTSVSKKGKRVHMGSRLLRKALHQVLVGQQQHRGRAEAYYLRHKHYGNFKLNRDVLNYYDRLKAKGKHDQEARKGAERLILRQIFSCVRRQTLWTPDYKYPYREILKKRKK